LRRLALAVLVGAPAVVAAPASAATVGVTVGNNFYNPATVNIAQGDTVAWTWPVGSFDHSVTPNSGFTEPPNSGVRDGPSQFQHTFNNAGCFKYHCSVHTTMQGTVVVAGASCTQPPPGGGYPPPPDGTQPGGTLPDTTDPAISSLRTSTGTLCEQRTETCRRTRARVRFSLSEAAAVTATVELLRAARTSGRVVRRLKLIGRQGANAFTLTNRRLEAGRYRLRLSAKDAAGNVSPTARIRFRVVG
jgi:plastocyanin